METRLLLEGLVLVQGRDELFKGSHTVSKDFKRLKLLALCLSVYDGTSIDKIVSPSTLILDEGSPEW